MIVFNIDNFNINTASLGEHRVRELNDEINKLNKTKSYWDSRIIELGGGDQGKGRKFYDVEGAIIFFKYMSKYIFFSHELLCSSYIFMKIFFSCIFLHLFILFYFLFKTSLRFFCVTFYYFFSCHLIHLCAYILNYILFQTFYFHLKARNSPVHQGINIMEQLRTFLGYENYFKKKMMKAS